MSDPTNVTIYVAEKHTLDVIQLLYPPDEGEVYDGYQRLYYEDIDDGGEYEHKALWGKGIPHIMEWGSGSGYTEGALVFPGDNEVFTVDCIDGVPAVPCIDGEPVEHELERVRRFEDEKKKLIERWERAREMLYAWKIDEGCIAMASATSVDEAREMLKEFDTSKEPLTIKSPGAVQ